MPNELFKISHPSNEPIKSYAHGTTERESLQATIEEMRSTIIDIPMHIGGMDIETDQKVEIRPPHDIKHLLGYYSIGDEVHVNLAIDTALKAHNKWQLTSSKERADIFLKAADLIAGPYRDRINAATMLGQSKNAYQAEIDAACEFIDFLRFNVQFMLDIYSVQPNSDQDVWNRMEYRPLEGFVFALTPFNFTSIAANLPAAPALMGNVVVWKPSRNAIYSAHIIMEIFKEAGLPDGVINMVFAGGALTAGEIIKHTDFAGIHFTGSTKVFQGIWNTIGKNISNYKSYPRIVGETGGKDFILAHSSANTEQLATAIIRGGFEYQGQKCSAASRIYIPSSKWQALRELLISELRRVKMGAIEDFSNFINAVIDEASFDKLVSYIEKAKLDKDAEIIAGGKYDKTEGYFIEPTIILTTDPFYTTMEEELFGPVVTIYVYNDSHFDVILDIVNNTSVYALTGAIFSEDKSIIDLATEKLKYAAGNFYVNDKPTGAVVGQQPFGGARGSGTNDKAGSYLNLLRWVSPRTIKENFNPPEDFMYPNFEE